MEEQITLGFKDYAIIAYLIGMIIWGCIIHHYSAKPETYRILFAAIVSVTWPIPALLCVLLAIESVIVFLKDLITGG
jgi:hypothetical protein